MIDREAWHVRNAGFTMAAVYAFAAILTFGHSWVKFGPLPEGPFPPELLIFKVILSGICALFWPMYWSVRMWS